MNLLRFLYTIINPKIKFRGRDMLYFVTNDEKYSLNIEHLCNDDIILYSNTLNRVKSNESIKEIDIYQQAEIITLIRNELKSMLYNVEVIDNEKHPSETVIRLAQE